MAITPLRTNFKDDILNTEISDKRQYNLINNSNGTVSLEDVSTYTQIGDDYEANEINTENSTINQLISLAEKNKSDIDTLQIESEKAITTDKDFVLINQAVLSFTDNESIISDNRITEYSLADVFFTKETYETAEKALISVETYDKKVILSAGRTPEGTIKATIHIRVVTT